MLRPEGAVIKSGGCRHVGAKYRDRTERLRDIDDQVAERPYSLVTENRKEDKRERHRVDKSTKVEVGGRVGR